MSDKRTIQDVLTDAHDRKITKLEKRGVTCYNHYAVTGDEYVASKCSGGPRTFLVTEIWRTPAGRRLIHHRWE